MAFRHVGMPGRKLAQDESIRQEVEIPADTSGNALRKYVGEDLVRWREVVQRAQIKVE